MSNLIQYCTYKGHERNKVKYVCLDINCQSKRLFCLQCLLNNHQKHIDNNQYIKDQKGLQDHIQALIDQQKQEIGKISSQFLQKSIKIIKLMQSQMSKILDLLKELQTKSFIQKNVSILQNKLEEVTQNKLSQIDDHFINELINMDFYFNEKSIIQQIQERCNLITENNKILKQFTEQQLQILYLREIQYDVTQIDNQLNIDQAIYSATISNDMKYIAASYKDKYLRIWNSDCKLIQEYNVKETVQIMKFTHDSQYLHIGTALGLVCTFDVQNDFKQIYRRCVHTSHILNMYCLSNHIILTSSFDKCIIKTDLENCKQLLCINAHDDRIDGIDYNLQKDIIVSCSKDNFIKLWNINGELLIKQEITQNSILNQVLFIKDDQLISLDSNVKRWHVKYQTKQLLLLTQINFTDIAFNISLVLNHSYLFVLCEELIKFYTVDGEYVHSIKHDIKEFSILYIYIFIQICQEDYNQILCSLYLFKDKVFIININLEQLKVFQMRI